MTGWSAAGPVDATQLDLQVPASVQQMRPDPGRRRTSALVLGVDWRRVDRGRAGGRTRFDVWVRVDLLALLAAPEPPPGPPRTERRRRQACLRLAGGGEPGVFARTERRARQQALGCGGPG